METIEPFVWREREKVREARSMLSREEWGRRTRGGRQGGKEEGREETEGKKSRKGK